MNSIITFSSDFGTHDYYTGSVKGRILSLNPNSNIIDICHELPQNIISASYIISGYYNFFPDNTIHIIGSDYSTDDTPVLVKTEKYFFLCFDNCILSFMLKQQKNFQIFRIVPEKLFDIEKNKISCSFRCRDILATGAALLSLNKNPNNFAEPFNSIKIIEPENIFLEKEKTIIVPVIHIDKFGNIITNIQKNIIENYSIKKIICNEHSIIEKVSSYSEITEAAYLFGDSGYLEISCRNNSAAEKLKCSLNDKITIFY